MAGIREAIAAVIRSGEFAEYTENNRIRVIGAVRKGFTTPDRNIRKMIKTIESNSFEYIGESSGRCIFRTENKAMIKKYKTLKEFYDSL